MRSMENMRWIVILVALAALGLPSGCDTSHPTPEPAESPAPDTAVVPEVQPHRIEFVQGYARGYQDARAARKPMLVFFTAPWCDYCHQMIEEAFADRQVVCLSRQFVCILVDADREPSVCQQFGIRGYPTVQFLSPGGVPLNRVTGKTPGDKLALQMQAALQATASRLSLREATRR